MKEIFNALRDCANLCASIDILMAKKNKSPFERSSLKFKKDVLPVYLNNLKEIIEKYQNVNKE